MEEGQRRKKDKGCSRKRRNLNASALECEIGHKVKRNKVDSEWEKYE